MSIFSGVIPTITITKNSQANSFVGGLLNNLATSGVSLALSQTKSTELSNALGIAPIGGSNFVGSIFTPGLISTGVGALSQTITNTITNSKALGPAGPLVGNLVTAGVSYLGTSITNSLFGAKPGDATKGSLFFPGADGIGDGTAQYPQVSKGLASQIASLLGAEVNSTAAYAVGGGPDVVFSITTALSPAAIQAAADTGPSSPASPGAAPTAAPTGAPQPPATVPSPGAQPPAPTAGGTPAVNERATEESAPKKPPAGWKFICAPEDIGWQTSAQADRVAIFGANQAPVVAGVRGMRELTMNGAIVEGFTRGKTIEDKVIALEKLLDMTLSPDKRYLQVPVYKITANDKVYGMGIDEGGYFLIKDIKVQEKMRDLTGKATRAVVDINFIQVPKYQVESGRDIASQVVAGTKGPFAQIVQSVEEQARQGRQSPQQPSQPGAATNGAGR